VFANGVVELRSGDSSFSSGHKTLHKLFVVVPIAA
jgi:hypothetical protein